MFHFLHSALTHSRTWFFWFRTHVTCTFVFRIPIRTKGCGWAILSVERSRNFALSQLRASAARKWLNGIPAQYRMLGGISGISWLTPPPSRNSPNPPHPDHPRLHTANMHYVVDLASGKSDFKVLMDTWLNFWQDWNLNLNFQIFTSWHGLGEEWSQSTITISKVRIWIWIWIFEEWSQNLTLNLNIWRVTSKYYYNHNILRSQCSSLFDM